MKKLLCSFLSGLTLFLVTGTDIAFGAQRAKSQQKTQVSTQQSPFTIMYKYESKKFNDLYDLVTSHKPLFVDGCLNCSPLTREYLEVNELTIQGFIEYLEVLMRDIFFTEEKQYIQGREKAHKYLAHLQEILRRLLEEETLSNQQRK